MKTRLTSILLLALAAVMLLSACTGGEHSYDTETDPVTEAIEQTTEQPTEQPTETEAVGSIQESTAPESQPQPSTEEQTTEPPAPVDPLAQYELGYGSSMDMSAYDPIPDKVLPTAPNDDPNFLLWFDHITEKIDRYTIVRDGDPTYVMQMGKNEMEGCQFFVHSPLEKRITVKISDFTNANGDTLATELGVEYYVEDGYVDMKFPGNPVYPDAVVPYDAYISKTEGGNYEEGPWVSVGPYSYKPWEPEKYPYRDTSRAFVVQAITTPDTVPGAYVATIEICDADTGACIKMANVYTYVYNVTLSEETALDTTFMIWQNKILEQYANFGFNASDYDILKATADFLLKYRITPTGTVDFGAEWLKNPRVTTIRVTAKEQYDMFKNDPVLKEKLYFYGQDEPGVSRPNIGDPTGKNSVTKLKEEAEMLLNNWGWTDYRMVSPFEMNISYTTDKSKDQIDFMSRYVNIWCPKFFSFTPRALKNTPGAQFTHAERDDRRFGEFEERIKGYITEKGGDLWAYVSCVPAYTAPYQNILLYSDGTQARTMFWTCYELDVTGFLYWHVANYEGVGGNTFTMRCPFPKEGPGDGILIYPGAVYGQLDPIPSLRLICMREGIEDYQLLSMLEEAKGEDYAKELTHHIVTSTITFTEDDDTVYNVHSYLLRALAGE